MTDGPKKMVWIEYWTFFTPAERIDVCCQCETRWTSAFRGKAENICSQGAFPVLTHSRLPPRAVFAMQDLQPQ
jgi:hypothetical protein